MIPQLRQYLVETEPSVIKKARSQQKWLSSCKNDPGHKVLHEPKSCWPPHERVYMTDQCGHFTNLQLVLQQANHTQKQCGKEIKFKK